MPRAVYDPEEDRKLYEQRKAEEEAEQAQAQQQYDEETGETGPSEVNPLETVGGAITGALQPVSDFMENTAVSILDTFQPDKTREEIVAEREQARQKAEQRGQEFRAVAEADTGFGAETLRVLGDATVGTVEDVLNTGDLLGDYAKAGVQKLFGMKVRPTEDPFSDRYTAAAYNFGLSKPKTEVGQFASKLIKVVAIARQIAVRGPRWLTTLGTSGKGLKGAVASGIVPGAVADFITTTPEDENFSAMVNNFLPEDSPLHNSFVFALRSDENDDIGTAKLKAALEGGVIGTVADGLLWLVWGRKAAQRALKAGASKEEALQVGITEMGKKMKEVDSNHVKLIAKEGELWDEVNTAELGELLDVEQQMMAKVKALEDLKLPDSDPKLQAARETLEDVRLNIAEVDGRIARGYDPDDSKGVKTENSAAYNKPADPNLSIRQQLEAESPVGGMRQMPERPFLNEGGAPRVGGSFNMISDAQFKRMNYKPDSEALIREVSKRVDLQEMARKLKTTPEKIMEYAGRVLDDFRSALDSDVPDTDLVTMMRQSNVIDPRFKTGEKILSKPGVLVVKALIGDTADQISTLSKEAAELRAAGKPIGNQADRLLDRLVTLQEFYKTSSYEGGSYLENFKRVIGVGTDGINSDADLALSIKEVRDWSTKIKNLIRKGDPEADAEMQRLVNAMVLAGGDPTKQMKFSWAVIKMLGKQSVQAMYQSILSGPITHFRNAIGNSYSLIERPFSTFVRATVKGDSQVQASAIAGVHAMTSGFQDAWKIARTTFNTGTSANFNAKFAIDDFETQAMLRQMKLAASNPTEEIVAGLLEKNYRMLNNPWFTFPSRALMASDDFFKSLAARYRVYSKAKYEAIAHAATDADIEDRFNYYIKKFNQGIDIGTGRIVDKDLLDYAERATFQQDPGSLINSIGAAVDSLPLGAGKIFLPFIRTPGNLMGYGLEHLPLMNQWLRSFDSTYLAAKKNGDRLLMAEMEGRYATGVMLMGSLTTMALFTDVTGNYPADQQERKAWIDEGRPPMSIKVGNTWISYASFEPVNSMLAIAADMIRLTKMGGADAVQRIAHQFAYSITASYTDKSFLAGLSEIANILDPQNLTDPSGLQLVLNTANNYAPYAGLRRSLANSFEPYRKELRNELDRMLIAAAPGYGGDVPSITSPITGQKLLSAGGGLFNAVSPVRLYDANDDFVTNELTRIGYPTNNIVKTGEFGVKLEPQHREKLAQILAKSGLNKALENYMKSDKYKTYAKAYKEREINLDTFTDPDSENPPHIKELGKIIRKYKTVALNQLRQLDESYVMLVADEKFRRQSAQRGEFTKPDLQTLRQYAGLE